MTHNASHWLALMAGLTLGASAWSQEPQPAPGNEPPAQADQARVERERALEQQDQALRRAERERERALEESERSLEQARRALEEAAREVARLSAEIAEPVVRNFNYDVRFERFGRARLGVNVENAEDGARVVGVTPGSGAADAGIETGDVIVSIDGTTLAQGGGREPAEVLIDVMRDVEPEQGVLLRVLRDGRVEELTVLPKRGGFGNVFAAAPGSITPAPNGERAFIRLPDMPAMPRILNLPGMFSGPFRELELVTLTPALGAYFGTDEGLLVVRAPENDALELMDGDVILDIGGRTPTSPEHAMRILATFEPGETLRLTIMRQQRRETLELAIPGPARTG